MIINRGHVRVFSVGLHLQLAVLLKLCTQLPALADWRKYDVQCRAIQLDRVFTWGEGLRHAEN